MLRSNKKSVKTKKKITINKKRKNPISVENIEEAIDHLSYEHDGPITDFVILTRAMNAAATKLFPPDVLANAVYELLF